MDASARGSLPADAGLDRWAGRYVGTQGCESAGDCAVACFLCSIMVTICLNRVLWAGLCRVDSLYGGV